MCCIYSVVRWVECGFFFSIYIILFYFYNWCLLEGVKCFCWLWIFYFLIFFMQCGLKDDMIACPAWITFLKLFSPYSYCPSVLICCAGACYPKQPTGVQPPMHTLLMPRPTESFYAFGPLQIPLSLISLTCEKFLALILTSFSTSCCRWKVSSCRLFSASSLLFLSSSSIWRRARHSSSWRTGLSLNILFDLRAELVSQGKKKKIIIIIHTFMHVFFLLRAAGRWSALKKQELWAICRSHMLGTQCVKTRQQKECRMQSVHIRKSLMKRIATTQILKAFEKVWADRRGFSQTIVFLRFCGSTEILRRFLCYGVINYTKCSCSI